MRYAIVAISVLAIAAQTQRRVIGEVTAKDDAALTLRDDSGKTTVVTVDSNTAYLRVAPGETNLSSAKNIVLNDVTVGDRVLAQGAPATRIVVMARADIERKRTAEQEEWRKRGHAGTITAIDPTSKKITVKSDGTTFTVEPSDSTRYRRYAPDSVRFADAKPSAHADLKAGDQIRVLGNKEGDVVRAEIIVSGQFRNVAGTVASVNASAGEVRILDLATKQPLTVRTGPDSILRRMPDQAAAMIARRRSAGGNRGQSDIQQMLERMPALDVKELKPGDAVIVASTAGAEPGRVTAIALIAGVEPLLRDPERPSDARLGGNWNFDINIMP